MAISASTSGSMEWTNVYKVNGVVSTTTPNSYVYVASSAVGVNTPNYFKRVQRGELLPHTPWVQTSLAMKQEPAVLYVHRISDNQTWEHSAYVPTPWPAAPHWISGTLGNADTSYAMSELQRAAANINGQGYDALTGFVEAKKIGQLFKQTAKSLERVWRNTRKLRRGEILDAWAAGRYGYRTLAYDIRDLNDAVSHYDEKRTIWTERSGYSMNDANTETYRTTWASSNMDWVISDYTTHSIRGSVAAKIKPARFNVNPLITGWEVIPYSFVLDWVISIGDVLGTMQLLASAEAVTSSVGVKSVSTRTVTVDWSARSNHIVHGSYRYEATAESVTRDPTKLSLKPTLRGRILQPSQVLDLTSFVKLERTRIR